MFREIARQIGDKPLIMISDEFPYTTEIDKTPKVVPGEDWRVMYALFSRTGFTEAAENVNADVIFVDLAMLNADLKRKLPPAKSLGDLQI